MAGRMAIHSVGRAKLGNDERLAAIRQLDAQARALEGHVAGPSFDAFIAEEKQRAPEYGGRTVFDNKPPTLTET